MSLDLKIEIFARHIFYNAWTCLGIMKKEPKILPIFGEECCKVENCVETCDMMFAIPIICRRKMFGRMYLADFTNEKAESLKSSYDCYNYVISMCDRDDLFGHLTVFERMFATCGFIIDFCLHIYEHNIVDVVKYGPMFWAMYFDKFTEEFYADGGWSQLKEVARPYCNIYDIFFYFDKRDFCVLGKAIEDYYDFMDNDQYYEYKNKLKKSHVSKLWIIYNVTRFESCIETPISYQCYVEFSEIEELLQNLIGLYNCISKTPICIDMEYSENSDEYDTYLENLNALEVLSTNQTDESLCYTKSPLYSIPGATDVCSEKGVMVSVTEEPRAKKTLEVKQSSKNCDDQKKNSMRTEIIFASQLAQSELDRKGFSSIPTRHITDSLYSENTKKPSATSTASRASSKDKISICKRKTPSYSVPDATKFCPEKGVKSSVEEEARTKDILKVSCSSTNDDDEKKIVMRADIISTCQMAKSKSDGNSVSFIPTRQVTDNLHSGRTDIQSVSPTALEASSKNQMVVSKSYRKSPPYSVKDTAKISSEKSVKGSLNKVCNIKTLEVNCKSKNDEDQNQTPMRMEIISTEQAAEIESNGKSSPDILPTRQFLDMHIDSLSSRNSERECKTLSTPKVVSISQKDISLCCRNLPPYCDSYTTNFSSEKAETGNFEEISIEKSFEMNCSLKNIDQPIEISKRTDTISTRKVVKSELDGNYQHIPIERCPDNFHSGNRERPRQMSHTPEGLSYDERDAPLWHRKPLEHCISDTMNFSLDDRGNGEDIYFEKTFEVNCNPKNKDDLRETPKRTEIKSINQMTESELNIKSAKDILPTPRDLNPEKRCEYTNDKMDEIGKVREGLKNEQDDHDINIFLRMILVLGDRQRTKFLYQELQNSKDGPEKTQSTRKRKKKKNHKKNA